MDPSPIGKQFSHPNSVIVGDNGIIKKPKKIIGIETIKIFSVHKLNPKRTIDIPPPIIQMRIINLYF